MAEIRSLPANAAYRENWDRIFGTAAILEVTVAPGGDWSSFSDEPPILSKEFYAVNEEGYLTRTKNPA